MSRIIMLIPTGTSVGLTSVSLGVIRAMERKGVRLSVFKPISQPRAGGDAPDQTTSIVRANSSLPAAEPLKMSHVESLLSSNQKDVLMEEIIANYHANTKDAEVVLVEGLVPTRKHQFAQSLNYEIAKTLNAEIVFVMSQGTDTPEQLNERIELTRSSFGGAKNAKEAIYHIEGDPDHPVSRGALCPKGAGLLDYVHSENRLRYPQYRAPGSDKWQRISWDEAFNRIARLMKADRDANFIEKNEQGVTVNRWLSTGMLCASAASNETGMLTQKFVRSLGMLAVDNQARV